MHVFKFFSKKNLKIYFQKRNFLYSWGNQIIFLEVKFSVRHTRRFNEKQHFWKFLMKIKWKHINNFESLIFKISQPNSHYTRSTKLFQSLSLMFVCLMVFNATFKNISVISWRSVLLVEETEGPGGNHRPVASHWQTLSHNGVHLALIEIQTHKHQWW